MSKVICEECGAVATEAPGIGHYCPNQDCDVGDGPELRVAGEDLENWEWGPDRETLTCTWDEAWSGPCGDAAVSDDPPRCEDHEGQTCIVCDKTTVKGCHATGGGLVCGAPLCRGHTINDCPHYLP